MDVATKIPVNFEVTEQLDERFLKVTITLMHLGENYNGSFFSKEVVLKALPTLANTPILGYIEPNSQHQEDFSDHRVGLEKVDGEWTLKYLGSAYGVIPENNNARFEVRTGSDGVEREYLVVDGLLWTKFEDSTNIFNRDLVKSQSMELSSDYEGYWNDETKLFHFSKFKFNGACALGFDVNPAMYDANIALKFTYVDWETFKRKVDEFNLAFHSRSDIILDKGGIGTVNKENLIKLFSTSKEEIEARGVNFEEISVEDLLVKLAEFSAEKYSNLETELNTAKEQFTALEATTRDANSKLEEVTTQFEAVKSEKEQIQEKFTSLENEVKELREFKASKITEERKASEDAVFSKFEKQLTIEEMASVKEAASEMTIEEIEVQLFALVGKKVAATNFSKNDKSEPNKLKIDFNVKSKTGEPAWAHLLEGN